MAKNKIDAFENKIESTYQSIINLENKDASYQKQRDYSQLMITTSSTFADISDVLVDLPLKVKNNKIKNYANTLIEIGVDAAEANNAINALFGEKQITKSMCENVFCPYIKETFNLLRNDGYVDMGKIENAIKNNDQDFELSPLLNKEVKEMNKKNSFIYKLFHKNDKEAITNNKPIVNNSLNDVNQEKIRITVKEALANETKEINNVSKNRIVQNTKEVTKSNDEVIKR